MITIKTYRIDSLSTFPYTLICTEETLKKIQSYYVLCGYHDEIKNIDIDDDGSCTFEKITVFTRNNETPITKKEKEIIDAFAKLYGLRRRKYYDEQGKSFYSWEPPDGGGGEGM